MLHETDSYPGRRPGLAVFLLLTALTLATLGPVVFNDFINYDDPVYVTANPVVSKGLSGEGVRWALTAVYDGNWFPVTWLSHMIDVSLYGLNPAGHHLSSLMLHLANTLLVFVVLQNATRRRWPSALAAALFAVHPLHVEPVAWVAERKELLGTFFGLLAAGAYIRYVSRPAVGRYLAVMILFLLSLSAKPMWMTFPLLMLVLDIWPLGRLRFTGAESLGQGRRSATELFVEKIPLFGISVLSGLLALFTQHSGGGVQSFERFSLPVRVANALVAYIVYLKQTIWPSGLSVYYPHPGAQIGFWKPAAAAILLVAISLWTIRRIGDRPYLVAGWAWYLISLLPVIGLVQLGTQAMANRYAYVPLIGIFFAATWGGRDIFAGRTKSRVWPVIASGAVILSLAAASRVQLGYWENSMTLFAHARQTTRPNIVVLINLGKAYESREDFATAETLYRQALDLNPTHPVALFNTARIASRRGDRERAEALYRRMLSLYPEDANAASNLAGLLVEKGLHREALRWYRAALAAEPNRSDTLANLANLFSLMGRFTEARRYFERALVLTPDDATTHQNYAEVLARKGHIEEAIDQLAEAIRAGADRKSAYCRMGRLLAAEGNPGGAQKFFRLAGQGDPSPCRKNGPKTDPEMQKPE
ncbi:MAG: tetratricopeptide repeat protein [Desulfobacterales bacterium]